MIVTDAELAGLNRVSGGGYLPGISLPKVEAAEAGHVMDGLRAKGVLDADRRLTPFGMVPLAAVEQYRTASRHVFINRLRASLNPDGHLTVIHPSGDGWYIARLSPAELLVALLKAYPFLCSASAEDEPGPWRPMTLHRWATTEATRPSEGIIMVRGAPTESGPGPLMAGSRADEGYVFDLSQGRVRSCPIRVMRLCLADRIGLDTSLEVNDG